MKTNKEINEVTERILSNISKKPKEEIHPLIIEMLRDIIDKNTDKILMKSN